MTGAEERSITVDGSTLRLRLQRKGVKNVNARLKGDVLAVSAPRSISVAELETIIRDLARRLVRRSRASRLDRTAALVERARRIATRFPAPAPAVADVRFAAAQGSRWGSYSLRTGIVRLNPDLADMPPWVLDAVIAHELAHALLPDHSRQFWDLVRRVCPDTDRARGFLEGVSWQRHTPAPTTPPQSDKPPAD